MAGRAATLPGAGGVLDPQQNYAKIKFLMSCDTPAKARLAMTPPMAEARPAMPTARLAGKLKSVSVMKLQKQFQELPGEPGHTNYHNTTPGEPGHNIIGLFIGHFAAWWK